MEVLDSYRSVGQDVRIWSCDKLREKERWGTKAGNNEHDSPLLYARDLVRCKTSDANIQAAVDKALGPWAIVETDEEAEKVVKAFGVPCITASGHRHKTVCQFFSNSYQTTSVCLLFLIRMPSFTPQGSLELPGQGLQDRSRVEVLLEYNKLLSQYQQTINEKRCVREREVNCFIR